MMVCPKRSVAAYINLDFPAPERPASASLQEQD